LNWLFVSTRKLYHHHPGLVKDDIASLCSTCQRHIKSSKSKIPKLYIAAGIDFVHPGRLGLPQLTLSEELLLFVAVVNMSQF
jgi:hypothetical protein